jgi:hypothetical protein
VKQTRFTIDRCDGWTECECPPQLCRHENQERPYVAWTVWDHVADDHAFNSIRDFRFADEYLLKRDAKADLDRYLAERERWKQAGAEARARGPMRP